MKKITRGNDFTMRIPVCKIEGGEQVPYPLPACTDIVVNLVNAFRRRPLEFTIDVSNDNIILAKVDDNLPCATYALEVKGKFFGNDWRSNEYEQIQIVDNNASADYKFAEMQEGENSVDMDTAIIILAPSVELEGLIADTGEALKRVDEAIATTNELAAKVDLAEQKRVAAEQERTSSETTRKDDEQARVDAENVRVTAEKKREQSAKEIKVATEKAVTACQQAVRDAQVAVDYDPSTGSILITTGK